MRELLHEGSADAIVVDPTFAAGSLLAGLPSQDRPALVVVGVVPLALPGPDLAPFGMGLAPAGGPLGHLRNRILQTIADRTVLAGAQAAGRRMHEHVLGSPIEWPVLAWADHADAILQLSVASFEYPRPATRTELTFLGPVASSSGTQYPLPEWWADLDGSRPVVHVTQGTNANSDPTSLIQPTIEAFADGSALVVVATGGLPLADLGSLPAYVRAAEFLPYDELFARTDAFVTNGGYGGVQFSLRQGVPLVVAPGKEDKVEVAARVEWSGSGINLRRERPRAAQLRRAVERVLCDGAYRARVKTIAAEIAAAPGADGFPAALDALIAHHRGRTSDRGEPDFLRGLA